MAKRARSESQKLTPEEVAEAKAEDARVKRLCGMGGIAPPLGKGEVFDYNMTRPTEEELVQWGRPPLSREEWQEIDGKQKDLVFQLTDCQSSYVDPRKKSGHSLIKWNGTGQVPVVRLYGVMNGHSICVNVWNFAPYMYLNTPNNLPHHKLDLEALEYEIDAAIKKARGNRYGKSTGYGGGDVAGGESEWTASGYQEYDAADETAMNISDMASDLHVPAQHDRARFYATQRAMEQGIDPGIAEQEFEIRQQVLQSIRRSSSLYASNSNSRDLLPYDKVASHRSRLIDEEKQAKWRPDKRNIVSIEAVNHRIVDHYQPDTTPLLKINLRTPNLVTILRDLVDEKKTEGLQTNQGLIIGPAYDAGVLFETRFMVDRNIAGSGYVKVSGPFWRRRRFEEVKDSNCQIEIDADFNEVVGLDIKSNSALYSQPSKMRVMSRDTEIRSLNGDFPVSSKDPIIVIHNVLFEVDNAENPIAHVGFCLGSLPMGSVRRHNERVICYETEKEMLNAYGSYLSLTDPDITTGYNTKGFDAPYLYDRAALLGANDYLNYTRLKGKQIVQRSKMRISKNTGNRESILCIVEGRVEIDVMQYIQDSPSFKLRSYSLNSVSEHFLKDRKDDVSHKIIPVLYMGSPTDRMRLVNYCKKDADLPRRLMIHLKITLSIFELSRVQGVQVKDQMDGSPSGRAFACFLKQFKKDNFVVPYRRDLQKSDYVGASVFEPIRGFYKKPIVILDFASLYPSEMMAHNLCYTMFVAKADVATVAERLGGMDKLETCPEGHTYVRSSVEAGILPKVLRGLVGARSDVKKLLETEKDSRIRSTLSVREVALKVVSNSVYGFCGLFSHGVLWQEIAASTTAYGREQIKETRRIIVTEFTKAAGRPGDAQVLYGDTDSVMVDFGVDIGNWDSQDEVAYAVEQAQTLAAEAAARCTKAFAPPNKLQVECIIMPFLLINKKRYGGLIWNSPLKWSSMKLKGIESVRRDNCRHVARTQEQCLRILFEQMDPDEAIKYASDSIAKLRKNQVDMYDLIISGSLSKKAADYKNPQAHAFVSELIKLRSPGSEPHIGDRVPYVIVSKDRDKKRYQRAEDPVYALEKDLNIDTEYYVENQMMGPLQRIFEPIFGEEGTNRRLRGDGNRVRIVKLGEEKTGLLKFFEHRLSCQHCGVSLPKGSPQEKGLLCKDCEPHRLEEVTKCMGELRINEMEFSRLWTTCSSCQGSVLHEVFCNNTDCPIFFKRTTVARDLDKTRKRVSSLSLEW